MKFKYTKFSKELRFTIGIEEESGLYFLSFPVNSSRFADDEEYYEISEEEYKSFSEDLNNGVELLNRCKKRQEDSRLLSPPADPRGEPC